MVCDIFYRHIIGEIAGTMIERRRPEKLYKRMNLATAVSILVVILIILSSLICFASAARQSAFSHPEIKVKDHKAAASGLFKPSGKDCHSGKPLSHCSPPLPRQMGNSNITGADKRIVPTGPNPLHNR